MAVVFFVVGFFALAFLVVVLAFLAVGFFVVDFLVAAFLAVVAFFLGVWRNNAIISEQEIAVATN